MAECSGSKRCDENILKFKSLDYPRTFFQTLQDLQQQNVFCDVVLEVETIKFSCHKIVLMCGSPYFHAMFINNMSEHDKKSIAIQGVSSKIFSVLMGFLYTGEVDVTEENCEDLLAAADMFAVSEVITACSTFLKERLLPENCVGIYQFAKALSCHTLSRDSEIYIHKHFLKVVKEEEFFSMPKDSLLYFLNSECLHVENEFQVFRAAIDWILHNPGERRKHVFDAMASIRFPIIPETQTDKYISSLKETDLSLSVALQKIVSDFKITKKSSGAEKKVKIAEAKQHLTVPRQCARKSIFICGGFTRPKGGRWSDSTTLNTVEKYDTFYKTWHESPSFQYHRSALGAGIVDGQVCVVGGENDMLILDSVEVYDPVTYQWNSLPGLISPRCGLGVCTIDNCLFAVGGWIGSEIGNTIEKFDPDDQKWMVVGHMRKLKCWMGITGDRGLMYLVGGCNDLSEVISEVESFNPVTKEWTTLPNLLVKRSYTGVAVLDDCLYAVGGWNESLGALNSVEKFSFKKGFWEEVSPLTTARAGLCVVVVNNMLYVMGGRNYLDEDTAPTTLDTMEAYDPVTDVWHDMGKMLSSRCEGAAVVV